MSGCCHRRCRHWLSCSISIVWLLTLTNCRQETTSPGPLPAPVDLSLPTTSAPGKSRTATDSESGRAFQKGDWFEDVTGNSGVRFVYQTGREAEHFTILETVGGGLGFVDFDMDSFSDLFAVGGGTLDPQTSQPTGEPCRLFRNVTNGSFSDVSDAAGIPQNTDYSHGCLAGDVDNDGFPDLLVTCYGRNTLLLNMGDGTFEKIPSGAIVSTSSWHTAAAFGDLDNDGVLDVYVVNYVDWKPNPAEKCQGGASRSQDVCPPQRYAGLTDEVYRNLGQGEFENVSQQMGIVPQGKGLGVIASNWNNDRFTDFYVANDVVRNHLYWGRSTFPFEEQGEISGTAYNAAGTPEGSMGVDLADVNGDGLFDLWVTNYELEENSLYVNLGEGQFQHATARFGLAGPCRPYVGFGTGFHDFDGDGWPDLYILNGHVQYHAGVQPFQQPAFLYRNLKGTQFENITPQGGSWFALSHAARGGAVADFDNDGALDLAISRLDDPLTLLRNRNPVSQWIRLQLVGTRSNRDGIGARVALTAFGRETSALVKSGAGYLSQSDMRLHFALERSKMQVNVQVDWPTGRTERFENLLPNRDQVLVEGQGVLIE